MRERNKTKTGFMKALPALAMCAALAAPTGCLSVRTNLLDVQTSAKPMEKAEYEIIGDSEGTHSQFNLFWFIPVTPRVSRQTAVDEAIASKGADNLIFVRTWRERQVWILGTVSIIHVKGQAVRYGDQQAFRP